MTTETEPAPAGGPPDRRAAHGGGTRQRVRPRRGRATRRSSRRRPVTPLRCSRSKAPRVCRSSCRSGTGACSSRRSRSIAARRTSWRTISRQPRAPGSNVQLCGDAHLVELRRLRLSRALLVFDLNDFDETLAGPVRMGRQAAHGELRGRRARPRLQRRSSAETAVLAVAPCLPRGDARLRHDEQSRRSGTRGSTSTPRGAAPRAGRRQGGEGDVPRRGQGAHEGQHEGVPRLTEVVDGSARIVSDPPLIVPLRDFEHGLRPGGDLDGCRRCLRTYRQTPARRPPASARELPLRRPRTQGRRRRQRRDTLLDPAAARPRRRRPAVPAGQGGRAVRARAAARQERLRQPRPAHRRRAAADAGLERHLPRLDPQQARDRRRRRATSTFASCGTGRHRSTWSVIKPVGLAALCAGVRLDARARACAFGRPDRDRGVPRQDQMPSIAPSQTSPTAYADLNERDYPALVDAAREGRIVVQEGL